MLGSAGVAVGDSSTRLAGLEAAGQLPDAGASKGALWHIDPMSIISVGIGIPHWHEAMA